MKSKCIGIIGGAGPLAGVLLLERIFLLSGQKYGCYKDADFPKVILISFPFSEMLGQNIEVVKLQQELNECIDQLRKNGSSVLTIACNTLHAFLDPKNQFDDLVQLPSSVVEILLPSDIPLVLCTSTSARFELHRQFFPCTYPGMPTQLEIDGIIDQILKGDDKGAILEKLESLIRTQNANTIVLGCTELSIFSTKLSVHNKRIIDPLELVAGKVLEKIFLE